MPEHHYARQDYAYISGAIRVKDRSILDTTDIERMVDAPTLQEAFTVLNDTDYADNLLGVEAKNFTIALNRDLVQLRNFIHNNVASRRLISIIFLAEDWHNIKLAFKEKYLEQNPEGYFSEAGLFNAHDLRHFVLSRRRNGINKYTKREIEYIDMELTKEASSHRIDMLCDQSYFKLLFEKAKSYKNKEIINYVTRLIDVANLKILIRARQFSNQTTIVETYSINGGSIKPETLSKTAMNTEMDWKNIKPFLDQEFCEYLTNANGDYRLFERMGLEYVGRGITNTGLYAYGPEVVLDYYFRKSVALQNIRLILIGKANEIGADDIREKLITLAK